MTAELDASELRKLRERIAHLQGAEVVPLSELLPDSFIREYTRFETLQTMLDAAGVKGQEDVDSDAFSEFVRANSRFENYETMCHMANIQRIKRKGGL